MVVAEETEVRRRAATTGPSETVIITAKTGDGSTAEDMAETAEGAETVEEAAINRASEKP